MKGIIFDLKRFAVHDGPGIRTTVFLKGCPLACRWCHNPESIDPMVGEMPKSVRVGNQTFTENETVGFEMTETELMRELLKDQIFWEESGGGVTFSGGEPLLQHAFLKEMLQACRVEGLHTSVDTSGFATSPIFKEIIPLTSLFLYDLKLMDDKLHQTYTGVSNRLILNNLRLLSESGAPYRLRLPMIPDVTVTEENLLQMMSFIQTLPKAPQGIDLLPFHRTAQHKYDRMGKDNLFRDQRLLTQKEMNDTAKHFQQAGFTVRIGG
jgi:pyruvate formate lyase activating enzyme